MIQSTNVLDGVGYEQVGGADEDRETSVRRFRQDLTKKMKWC